MNRATYGEIKLGEAEKNDLMFKIIEEAQRKREHERWKLIARLEILDAEIKTLEEERTKYENPWGRNIKEAGRKCEC